MLPKDIEHIKYKRLIFSVSEYFLTERIKLDADINYFIQCPKNAANSLSEFYTLLVDLTQPIETIREAIYHRTVSEINSFINNQHYEHKVQYDLSSKELDYFIRLFNNFATEKGIRKAEKYRLRAYNAMGILAVSYIKLDGRILYINFYRVTRERAANISSFSVTDKDDRKHTSSLLSRAHRALHWLDILVFKKTGVKYYDFCGWYSGNEDQNLLNINKFKEQFTQNKIKEYTGVIYKNKLLIFLKKMFRNG